MAYDVKTDSVRNNDKTAEGAIPFRGDQPPTDGPSSKYDGLYTGEYPGHADCVPELLAAGPETQKPDAHEGPIKQGGYVLGSGRPD